MAAGDTTVGSTPTTGGRAARALLEAPPADTLNGKRDRAILATFLHHGLRCEELCGLRVRDRTYENQQHRASGLNLVVAAIALWNTVYLERAIRTLLERGFIIDHRLLAHLSPLKWEHINLTGDYHWRRDGGLRNRKLRPLRSQPLPDFAS